MKTSFYVLVLTLLISCKSMSQSNQPEQLVLLETKYGNMKIKLYNETPQHRDNFIKLVKQNFFDSLLFHRVINQFMIQGGDPNSKNAPAGAALGTGGPGYTIPAEFNSKLIHKKGALSAARMGDQVNPQKASSGSQFYIVQGQVFNEQNIASLEMQTGVKMTDEQKKVYSTVGGTPFLDNQYTVFGEVVEGLDVIDKIATLPGDGRNRPNEDVIFTIKVIEK